MADNKLVGQPYTTPDLVAKVTGKAKYAEDFRADGMLFCKLLLSPMPHARVKSIDSTAAITRIGSPSYTGSIVSGRSPCAVDTTFSPSVAPATGPGRSSAVRMALTPGIASAALASMCVTLACGIGLRSSFANSIPSARKSSAYFAFPVTFATRSGVV